MKNTAKLGWMPKLILIMTVSCWGPKRLAHLGDFRSSQSSKPQKLHRPPLKRTTKSLLWYSFRGVEWKDTSVTAAEFYGAVIPSNLHIPANSLNTRLNSLFSNCHLKKLACFYEIQFGRVSLNISRSDFVLETKRLQAKEVNSTCWTIRFVNYCGTWTLMVFEFWWFDIFDRFSLVRPIRLFELF